MKKCVLSHLIKHFPGKEVDKGKNNKEQTIQPISEEHAFQQSNLEIQKVRSTAGANKLGSAKLTETTPLLGASHATSELQDHVNLQSVMDFALSSRVGTF